MYKIFVIEDEPVIADAIVQGLQSWGYQAKSAADLRAPLEELKDYRPDLILMDLYLPHANGLVLTRQIRKDLQTPIVFLTSADDNGCMISALLNGADDYLTKPFDFPVLAAKIQAILRRTYDFADSRAVLEYEGVRYYPEESVAEFQDQQITLTANEGKIFRKMMMSKTRICSREDLMEAVWNTDCYIDENTLSVNVNRLRKKLSSIGVDDFIKTRKGLGYSL